MVCAKLQLYINKSGDTKLMRNCILVYERKKLNTTALNDVGASASDKPVDLHDLSNG
jgi:hypothetical protein